MVVLFKGVYPMPETVPSIQHVLNNCLLNDLMCKIGRVIPASHGDFRDSITSINKCLVYSRYSEDIVLNHEMMIHLDPRLILVPLELWGEKRGTS